MILTLIPVAISIMTSAFIKFMLWVFKTTFSYSPCNSNNEFLKERSLFFSQNFSERDNLLDNIDLIPKQNLPNNHFYYDEEKNVNSIKIKTEQLGWNCFDIACKIDGIFELEEIDPTKRAMKVREMIVDNALICSTSLEFRQLLALEIKHAASLTVGYLNSQDEQKDISLVDNLMDNSNKMIIDNERQEFPKELMNIMVQQNLNFEELKTFILPTSMHCSELTELVNNYYKAHDNMHETLQFCKKKLVLTKRLSPEELYHYFSDNHNHVEIATLFFDRYNSLFKPHSDALEKYCTKENVFRQYVHDYYGGKGWFVFHRKFKEELSTGMIDIVASMIQKQIFICCKDDEIENENGIIYKTDCYGEEKIFVQYDGKYFYTQQDIEKDL